MWRPKDWDAHKVLIEAIRTIPAREWTREKIIEAGADAMLEALKRNGMPFEAFITIDGHPPEQGNWVVFIPDNV